MDSYQILKKLWKKLGIKGHAVNYSSKPLWIVEGEEGVATAYLFPPMTKSPNNVDVDGFRRMDGKPIDGHKSWWKISDGSTIEIYDAGNDLKTSKIKRTPVTDVALSMTCSGDIANARPVFPSTGKPYIRTRRDREIFNNLEVKG